MTYAPLAFFSRVVKPGDPVEVELDDASVLVTSITFGETVKGDKRSALSLTYLDRMAEPDEEIMAAEKEEEDEDGDSDASFETGAVLKKTVIASLIPGKIENAAVHVVLNSNEAYEISVTGDNEVHLSGQYVFFGNDGPEGDSDSEDSDYDEDDEELDSDEFGEYDPETGLLGGEITGLTDGDEDSDEDDMEEDDSRFEELNEESPKKANAAKALAKAEKVEAAKAVKAAQKSEEAAADVSMDAGDVSTLSADTSKLSKNQKKKLKKLEKQGEAKAPEAAAAAPAAEAKKAAPAPAAEKPAATEAKKPSKKQTLPSGLVIEDAKVGKGPAAKTGQVLSMRYIGKLANGKVFDQNTKGQPFKFKLGVGEVIKGWDEGLKGMAAGGERKLTIPAPLAYGKKGVDGIPGGATLSFDVKLLAIK